MTILTHFPPSFRSKFYTSGNFIMIIKELISSQTLAFYDDYNNHLKTTKVCITKLRMVDFSRFNAQ